MRINILLVIGVLLFIQHDCIARTVKLEKNEAIDFLKDNSSPIQKRFFYTAKEQRREAKENYEEKCERSAFSKVLNKPRWCPLLELWPEWVDITKEDGNRHSNKYELFKKKSP